MQPLPPGPFGRGRGAGPVPGRAAGALQFVRYKPIRRGRRSWQTSGRAAPDLVGVAGRCYWVRTVGHGGDAMTAAIRNAFRPRELS